MTSSLPTLIFSISSGRAGSEYLSTVLATGRDVVAEHEAVPQMHGEPLTRCMHEPLDDSYASRRVKADAITRTLQAHPNARAYAETNHMFIKTFHDVVLREFAAHPLFVVHLRRPLVNVLHSFVRMGYFTDRNRAWPAWMHEADVPNALVPVPPGPRDSIDRAIGYLLDIEARGQRFAREFPQVKTIEARLSDLQDRPQVEDLFAQLGIEPTETTWNVVGKRVNERTERKAEIGVDVSLETCAERIEGYLRRCDAAAFDLPRQLALALR